MIRIIALITLFYSSLSVAVNVTFLNPAANDHDFWNRVTVITKMAAKDLGINLSVVYGNDNRVDALAKLKEIAHQENKPEYLLFMPYTGNAKQSYDILEEAKIPFYTLERSVPQTERERLGKPGEIYKYWLGEVYHDNILAGAELAKYLLEQTLHTYDKNSKRLIAFGITGDYSGESYDRSKGLLNSMMTQNQVKLEQVIHANWNPAKAQERFELLINRYGEPAMVWTASDTMAMAVYQHWLKIRKNQNSKLIIGGFDWLPQAIRSIEENKVSASIGGHVFLGAWGLVKVYDHNIASKGSKFEYNSVPYSMSVINKNNLDKYRVLFDDKKIDSLDFRRFSLSFNKEQESYNFTANAIINYLSDTN